MSFRINLFESSNIKANKFISNSVLVWPFIISFLLYFLFNNSSQEQTVKHNSQKPNVVFIMADDLGYGDLSCYGQEKFSTPHIDKLAKEGLLFKQAYAGSTVCAPSRATLLTGLHTGHTQVRGNKPYHNGQLPLKKGTFTIAELFKRKGYVTGAFGKWGLGGSGTTGDPLHHGFDHFFGYLDQRLAHHYYPYYLWENEELITLEANQGLDKGQYAPDLIHEKALEFIEENKASPFFLFYPTILPHAELLAPQNEINKYVSQFKNDTPFKGVDSGKDYKQGKYGSQKHPKATFVAMLKKLDTHVGELVEQVRQLGLEDNTIFVFTSDNGPHKEGGANPDFFNSSGNLRGLKRDLFEGGIRVPLLFKWKGKIEPNTTTDLISANWDMMPTFAAITNSNLKNTVDGISILPTLTGDKTEQKEHEYLYWEFHEKQKKQAIRKGDWKLVVQFAKNESEYFLFNLNKDPYEKNNLAHDHQDVFNQLKNLLQNARTPSEEFRFNFK